MIDYADFRDIMHEISDMSPEGDWKELANFKATFWLNEGLNPKALQLWLQAMVVQDFEQGYTGVAGHAMAYDVGVMVGWMLRGKLEDNAG